MTCGANTTAFRENLYNYLHMTGTDRPGDVDGEFGFTDQGYGDTPLEIVEVRGGFSEFTYQRVGLFSDEVLHLDSADNSNLIVSECSATRREICAGCLSKQQNQIMIRNSKDKIYVMGLFDVRQHNMDGLWSCGTNVTSDGIQQAESFLWALEQVNNDPQLLPGIQLGAIGLDGCGTHDKRTTEMARVFSSPSLSPGINGNQVVGLVVGTPDADPRTIYDLHTRHRLPIVLSTPGLEMPANHSPLLQLGPSVSIIAAGLTSILRHYNWTYVSAICSNYIYPYNAICEEYQQLATKAGVQFAVDVAVSDNQHVLNYWENIGTMILNKASNGARVLVALTPEVELVQMLTALKKQQTSLNVDEPIVLITLANENTVAAFTDVVSSVICLRNLLSEPGRFFDHFLHQKINLNTVNPWLMKYWTQLFHCRGIGCRNQTLDQQQFTPDPTVTNTINGVLAIAYGLEHVRKESCPDQTEGVCDAMMTPDLRRRVERAIIEHAFRDVTGRHVTFTANGVSDDAAIELVNVYQTELAVKSGTFSTRRGLEALAMKGRHLKNSSVVAIESITSRCLTCQRFTPPATKTWQPSQFMQIPSKMKPGFSLLGLMPFHRQGLKPLSCGTMHSTRVFQNLAAVAFALQRLQQNQTLPHSMQIGAVFFDSCGRVERAQQRLLSFLSDNNTQVFQLILTSHFRSF